MIYMVSLAQKFIIVIRSFGNLASLGGFAFGVTLGWNSSAGEILRNILNASITEIGLIGGILNAGACIGVMFIPLFIKYFSHITVMSLTMPGFIVGWMFVCCAGQKVCCNVKFRISPKCYLRITDYV